MESLIKVDNDIDRILDQVQNRLTFLENNGIQQKSTSSSTTTTTIVKKERKMNDYDEDELDPNLAFDGLQYDEEEFSDRRRKQTKNVGSNTKRHFSYF